jgi:hypothetical protein
MARVMVLMWGLELTFFAVVMFFLTPASTWAAVNDGPDACEVVEALAPWLETSGMATARLATAARLINLREIFTGPPPGFQ